MTIAALATLLATYQQPYETRCPGAQFAVQDDIPPFGTIRHEAGLVDRATGKRVALVFLMSDGRVYIQANQHMVRRDQSALATLVRHGDQYAPVQRMTRPVPNRLRVEACAAK